MSFSTDSNGINTYSPTPTGSAGLAINENFATISSLISGLLPLAGGTLTGPLATGGNSIDLEGGTLENVTGISAETSSVINVTGVISFADQVYATQIGASGSGALDFTSNISTGGNSIDCGGGNIANVGTISGVGGSSTIEVATPLSGGTIYANLISVNQLTSNGSGEIVVDTSIQMETSCSITVPILTVSLAASLNIGPTSTPATSHAIGSQGILTWDATYLYLCVATSTGSTSNAWKRIAWSTF